MANRGRLIVIYALAVQSEASCEVTPSRLCYVVSCTVRDSLVKSLESKHSVSSFNNYESKMDLFTCPIRISQVKISPVLYKVLTSLT